MDIDTPYGNQFVMTLRTDNVVDSEEPERFLDNVAELKSELAGSPTIDKPVALF